jgi:hypothetical protein
MPAKDLKEGAPYLMVVTERIIKRIAGKQSQYPFTQSMVAAAELVKMEEPVAITTSATEPTESRRLVINVSQTSDEDGDIARLNKIVVTLKDFPGRDEVQLNIVNGGGVTNLRLSNIHANYCPELKQRLTELVGESDFWVETPKES